MYEQLTSNDNVTLDIVGKASINEFNGNTTAQILVEDFNIIHLNKVIKKMR
jgi:hypothetical protein